MSQTGFPGVFSVCFGAEPTAHRAAGKAAAHRQPVQWAAVVLALQHAVATDLRAAEQPGDLGAKLREGGGETWQWAGRELRGRQCGQADVQRATPLLIHLIDPHLQKREELGGEYQKKCTMSSR